MGIGDIYITYISWGEDGKQRPVLFLTQKEYKVSVFLITTQFANKSETVRNNYFVIEDWVQAGLDKQSYIDTGGIIEMPAAVISGAVPIGKLTESDMKKLLAFVSKQHT